MSWNTSKRWSFQQIPADIPYFLNAKSTTLRAHLIDPKGFKINLLNARLEKAMPDEALSLGIALRSYTWIREVELSLLSTPVMFARLVVPYFALETTFQPIKHLGNRPLGRYLFKCFGIKREPFKIKKISVEEKLYTQIMQYRESCFGKTYQKKLPDLWARCSVFRYKKAPLLLTEVFLPQYSAILNLASKRCTDIRKL